MDMTGYVPRAVNEPQVTLSLPIQKGLRDVLRIPGVHRSPIRPGPDLTLNPPNAPAYDKSTIPFYDLYANDAWRMKPSVPLSTGWAGRSRCRRLRRRGNKAF